MPDAPAGVAAAAAALDPQTDPQTDPQRDAPRDTQTADGHQGRLAPAGVPGVAPDATGDDGSSIDGDAGADYFDALFARVFAALDYPRRARLDKIEGTVVLSIRIDREGRIERAEVAESSGSPLLDRHAMRIARRAAPFGAVPDFLADTDLIFELPVEFALTN